jgi:PPK2 family polyphosphate:nucleotide phosphotransferase
MADPAALHQLVPGAPVDLAALDPGDTTAAPGDKGATKEALRAVTKRLAELQEMLVVLQGLDTSGKGGTIKHVLGAVNPAGLQVVSFKAPSSEELARDYLWRVHAKVPAAGQIAVFNRSHYEDVLVVRVEGLVPEERWRRRYEHIAAFERLLVDEGTTVVKVLLHLSREEQKARLEARLRRPHKRWKYREEDLRTRRRWDDYQVAFSEALERTGTEHAPWHVVPADHKWYRNWAVATILVGAMERMGLAFPDPPDLAGVEIA